MALDPVCKTHVDGNPIDPSTPHVIYRDEVYFFCSDLCRQVFEEDPELFAESEFNNRPFRYSQGGEVTLVR